MNGPQDGFVWYEVTASPAVRAFAADLAARKQQIIDQINAAPSRIPDGETVSYAELKELACGQPGRALENQTYVRKLLRIRQPVLSAVLEQAVKDLTVVTA